MKDSVTVIRIEIPGLVDLLAYLRERDDNQQKKIDAMAAQLGTSTAGLKQSETALQGAIDNKEV